MVKVDKIVKKEFKVNDKFITSKIRIVRNLTDFAFTDNLNQDKKNKLEDEIINLTNNFKDPHEIYEVGNLTSAQKQFFIDNSIDGLEFFDKKNAKFIYFNKSKIAIVLNSSEHLKISIKNNEVSLFDQYKELNQLERKIGSKFQYAASSKYGFLTQEIKNCGLGMKLSVLVHLPGLILQNKFKDIFEDLVKKGYSIEKWFSEKDPTFYYIISSKLNFGVNETNLIERFVSGIESLLNMEKETLIDYYNNNKDELDDIIFRSFGILKYAKKIDLNEALSNISNLLIGIDLKLNLPINLKVVNSLVIEVLDGVIMKIAEIENIDPLTARANLIKKYLNTGENYV